MCRTGVREDKSYQNIQITPSGYHGEPIYSLQLHNDVMRDLQAELKLGDYVYDRIDIAIDDHNYSFTERYKLNRLVNLLISVKFKLKNCYESRNPLTLEWLSICAKNDRLQIENYNKALQSCFEDVAYNRVELRESRLARRKKRLEIYQVFDRWIERLKNCIDCYDLLQEQANDHLVFQFHKELVSGRVKSENEFIRKYQENVFKGTQLTDFFIRLGHSKRQAAAKATNFARDNRIEYIKKYELREYIDELVQAMKIYYT